MQTLNKTSNKTLKIMLKPANLKTLEIPKYFNSIKYKSINNVKITPELAKLILETKNTRNRKIKAKRVAQYVSNVKSYGWLNNTSLISFYPDGTVCEGQHRLETIVESGIPFIGPILVGVDEKGIPIIGGDLPKSTNDMVSILWKDIKISSHLNTMARQDLLAKNQCLGSSGFFSNAQEIEYLEENKEKFEEIAEFFYQNGTKREGVRRAGFVAAIIQFFDHNPEKAKQFVNQIITEIDEDGTPLAPRSPVRQLKAFFHKYNKNAGSFSVHDYNNSCYALNLFNSNIEECQNLPFKGIVECGWNVPIKNYNPIVKKK